MGVGFIPCLLLSLYLVSKVCYYRDELTSLCSCGGHHICVRDLPYRPRPGRVRVGRKAIFRPILMSIQGMRTK